MIFAGFKRPHHRGAQQGVEQRPQIGRQLRAFEEDRDLLTKLAWAHTGDLTQDRLQAGQAGCGRAMGNLRKGDQRKNRRSERFGQLRHWGQLIATAR